MQGKHAPALATIDAVRANTPEAKDAINGPQASFYRSILLVRAGRSDEGYAEVTRLLQVPFGSPLPLDPAYTAAVVQFRNDKHFNELIHRPPRL